MEYLKRSEWCFVSINSFSINLDFEFIVLKSTTENNEAVDKQIKFIIGGQRGEL